MKTSGLLTRMSLAWSRDGDKKFYVQDRMREVGREVVDLAGRRRQHLYLRRRQADGQGRRTRAGRYRRQFGARSTDEAVRFVAELKKKGRFQQDVY